MKILLKINVGLFYLFVEISRLTDSFNCDRCRDANLCDTVTGTFRATQLGKGYHPVVSLPRGACNVNVTELGYSGNTLTLKDTIRGDYILNGFWKMGGAGVYDGAGARFYYRKSDDTCPGECLNARGPVLSQVLVQLLYHDRNPGVFYTYKLPKHLKSVPRPAHTPVRSELRETMIGQRIIPDSDTEREKEAHPVFPQRVPIPGHGGIRHRGPIFSSDFAHRRRHSKDRSAGTRHDSRRQRQSLTDVTFSRGEHEETVRREGVDSDVKFLNESRSGSKLSVLDEYTWRLIEGECSRPCGGGVQEFSYICVNTVTLETVGDIYCNSTAKPEARYSVCNSGACTTQWNKGDWSECSVTCGSGTQTRDVTCKQRISATYTQELEDSFCTSRKPAEGKKCYSESCYKWVPGDWTECSATCGIGTRHRRVQCQDDVGRVVDRNMCAQSDLVAEESCDLGSCDNGIKWYFSQWNNKCSQHCGEGVVSRNVHCTAPSGPVMSNTNCARLSKPPEEKQCRSNSICGGKWFSGPWSQCSKSCGIGTKTRSVLCMVSVGNQMVTSEDSECRDEDKPRVQKNCTEAECGYTWYTTEWSPCSKSCGGGVSSRSVKCYDDKMEPSHLCTGSEKPEVTQACNTDRCRTSGNEAAPGCVDIFSFCSRIVQERTCRSLHTQVCCRSCHNLLNAR